MNAGIQTEVYADFTEQKCFIRTTDGFHLIIVKLFSCFKTKQAVVFPVLFPFLRVL